MFIKQEEKKRIENPNVTIWKIYQGKPSEQSEHFLKLAPKIKQDKYAGAVPH